MRSNFAMDHHPHGGEDHRLYMPRAEEAESWDRLDVLLNQIRDSSREECGDLIAAHVGSLFARIESAPEFGNWPIGQSVSAASPQWIESVVAHEIDRLILRMLDHEPSCVDCLLAWVRHLVEARVTLSKWAWARNVSDLLP